MSTPLPKVEVSAANVTEWIDTALNAFGIVGTVHAEGVSTNDVLRAGVAAYWDKPLVLVVIGKETKVPRKLKRLADSTITAKDAKDARSARVRGRIEKALLRHTPGPLVAVVRIVVPVLNDDKDDGTAPLAGSKVGHA